MLRRVNQIRVKYSQNVVSLLENCKVNLVVARGQVIPEVKEHCSMRGICILSSKWETTYSVTCSDVLMKELEAITLVAGSRMIGSIDMLKPHHAGVVVCSTLSFFKTCRKWK